MTMLQLYIIMNYRFLACNCIFIRYFDTGPDPTRSMDRPDPTHVPLWSVV